MQRIKIIELWPKSFLVVGVFIEYGRELKQFILIRQISACHIFSKFADQVVRMPPRVDNSHLALRH